MGFNNPSMPWRELHRRLIGAPDPPPNGEQPDGQQPDGPQPDVPTSRKRPPYAPGSGSTPLLRGEFRTPYAELHAHSAYSFLDGACSPEQLAEEATRLGLTALALTDNDGMYGIVRFAEAAEVLGLPTVFGAALSLERPLVVIARDPTGYASLCRAISLAQLRGSKDAPVYDLDELTSLAAGHWLLLDDGASGDVGTADLVARFGRDNVAVELQYALDPTADERYDELAGRAAAHHLPLVATTAARADAPARRHLAHAVAAIRHRSSLDELDGYLPAWGAHLRSGDEMAARFARHPRAVATAAALAVECAFDLRLVAPNLPPFPVPPEHRSTDGSSNEMSYLRELAYAGARERYGPRCENNRAYDQVAHELAIIAELGFPGYFLIVWEIVRFCRERGILCQGRGSAANSVVCYCLGVTAADPIRYQLLFERFLSVERGEPPDIDIDIESDRREEVIQHVYDMHGRHHAAQVANVITYRPRSAIRDVARALGYSPGQQDAWAKQSERYHWAPMIEADGSDTAASSPAQPPGDQLPKDQPPEDVVDLAVQLADLPRHLGIHSGGMVLCDRPVIEVCPVEWARMADRSVLQWDKDDCVHAGLVKFDLLGLGMLSALRYTFEFLRSWHGRTLDLYDIPADDPLVFDMLCRADTVGVFQIESRAQMSTLPRLQPRTFYDVVVEIALIRPGPIQGGSVHPYLRRRDGLEPITYPHPSLKPHLERTLGIPLFQEQLMQIAVAVAGFSPGEADELRRAMGNKRSHAKMAALRQRLYDGMAANGITGATADDIYTRIESFASFGFPESHSVSFAYLAMASSWLKLYYPAAFLAGLLNAQPMGFYSPQSLVHDARRHGVIVQAPDVLFSQAAASLEEPPRGGRSRGAATPYAGPGPAQPAVRLGLSSVRSIGTDLAKAIVAERERGGVFTSISDLARRLGLTTEHLEALATAGALQGLDDVNDRRAALWQAGAAAAQRPGQLGVDTTTPPPALPAMQPGDQMVADLWATGVSQLYPTALIRDRLDAVGVISAAGLRHVEDRTRVLVGGVVTHRQRPTSAGGVIFISLEDETGVVNVVVSEVVWQRHRRVARDSGALLVRGMLERSGGRPDDPASSAVNVVAERLERLVLSVRTTSRDFR